MVSAWGGNISGRFRAIKRATRGPRRRGRSRAPRPGPPVGPKLVVGRGRSRRRTDWDSILTVAFCLILAAALSLALIRFWVMPGLGA
ncbi:MAG: hypothetical protein ACYTGN_09980 [Planctomycetota bacterium]|jgi:hypothetical protein